MSAATFLIPGAFFLGTTIGLVVGDRMGRKIGVLTEKCRVIDDVFIPWSKRMRRDADRVPHTVWEARADDKDAAWEAFVKGDVV